MEARGWAARVQQSSQPQQPDRVAEGTVRLGGWETGAPACISRPLVSIIVTRRRGDGGGGGCRLRGEMSADAISVFQTFNTTVLYAAQACTIFITHRAVKSHTAN